MTKDEYTEIVDFMTPGASVMTMMSYCENAIIALKKQTILVYSNDDQGRLYQNCKKNITTRVGIVVLGCVDVTILVTLLKCLIW